MTRQRAVEARAEQCTKFDNTSFNGYFFTWVPYLGGEFKTLKVLKSTLKYTIEKENKCQTIAREVLLLNWLYKDIGRSMAMEVEQARKQL